MKPLCILILTLLIFSCKKDIQQNPTAPEPETPEVAIPGLAILQTDTVSHLTQYSASLTATIVDTGYSSIIAAGFVIDTIKQATLERNLDVFDHPVITENKLHVIVQNIPANKIYYVRAYAKNTAGVAYGNEVSFTSLNEKVYVGTVQLTSQEEVEDFAANHYSKIDGSLVINGSVTDLTPLRDLVVVNYALNINETYLLETLNGLENIEAANAAGGFRGIEIMWNKALKTTEGLQGLNTNEGYLTILDNPELVSLEGFRNLQSSWSGAFRIENCNKLANLEGLNRLSVVDGFLYLRMNEQLADISALNALSNVTDRIHIEGNPSLKSINGFAAMTSAPSVVLHNNENLSDLSGFANTTRMAGILLDSNKVTSLAGLDNIIWLDYLYIKNSTELTDIMALSNVGYMPTVSISQTGLTTLNGLTKIVGLYKLELIENNSLLSLEGLNNLESISGDQGASMLVARNDQLISLHGLEKLYNSNANIQVNFNPVLTDFCPLKKLFASNNPSMSFSVELNAVNPTAQEIISNCP
jgi:hypothetical protein